ncbi:MAG: hypothetical protein WCV84_05905 [Patescibacteria group bacterium]
MKSDTALAVVQGKDCLKHVKEELKKRGASEDALSRLEQDSALSSRVVELLMESQDTTSHPGALSPYRGSITMREPTLTPCEPATFTMPALSVQEVMNLFIAEYQASTTPRSGEKYIDGAYTLLTLGSDPNRKALHFPKQSYLVEIGCGVSSMTYNEAANWFGLPHIPLHPPVGVMRFPIDPSRTAPQGHESAFIACCYWMARTKNLKRGLYVLMDEEGYGWSSNIDGGVKTIPCFWFKPKWKFRSSNTAFSCPLDVVFPCGTYFVLLRAVTESKK